MGPKHAFENSVGGMAPLPPVPTPLLQLLFWPLLTGMPRNRGLYHNKRKLRKRKLEKCCNEGEAENQLHCLHLQASVPSTWSWPVNTNCLLYCRTSRQPGPSTAPLRITHCLRIQPDSLWSVFVHDQPVDASKRAALQGIPIESGEALSQLLE